LLRTTGKPDFVPTPAIRDTRRHYRLRYPLRLRPRMEIAGVQAAVIDISEGGIRIFNEAGLPLVLGETLDGALQLRSCAAARRPNSAAA
jgi:hypothetical protein